MNVTDSFSMTAPLPMPEVNADLLYPAVAESSLAMACAYEALVRRIRARVRWASGHRRMTHAASTAADVAVSASADVVPAGGGDSAAGSCALLDASGELPTVTNVAYTGRSVRVVHEGVAEMYHLLCPQQYVNPAVPAPDAAWARAHSHDASGDQVGSRGRVRVGIVCQTLRGHTLTRLLGGVVAKLSLEAARGIDIVLLSRRAWVGGDAVADALRAMVGGRMVTLPDSVDQARTVVERQRLDVRAPLPVGLPAWQPCATLLQSCFVGYM